MQDVLVALIVLGCTAYAAWSLMPAAWRRALAARLATGPWPAAVTQRLRRVAEGGGGGCGGCDSKGCAPTKKNADDGAQPLHFHPPRRPPR